MNNWIFAAIFGLTQVFFSLAHAQDNRSSIKSSRTYECSINKIKYPRYNVNVKIELSDDVMIVQYEPNSTPITYDIENNQKTVSQFEQYGASSKTTWADIYRGKARGNAEPGYFTLTLDPANDDSISWSGFTFPVSCK
jgi:hypothetical protein